jgi:hypothetical protein
LSNGQFTIIDVPGANPSFGTITTGINDNDDIVGSYSGPTPHFNDFHGFALINGQYTRIDVPGAVFSETFSINNGRIITGGYADAAGRIHGYIAIPNR